MPVPPTKRSSSQKAEGASFFCADSIAASNRSNDSAAIDQAGSLAAASWRKDENVELVNPPLIVDEFEIRPGAPMFVILAGAVQEIEGIAFPIESRLADDDPSRRFHLDSHAFASRDPAK